MGVRLDEFDLLGGRQSLEDEKESLGASHHQQLISGL